MVGNHVALGVADKHSMFGCFAMHLFFYHGIKVPFKEHNFIAWCKLTHKDANFIHCLLCKVCSFLYHTRLNWHYNTRVLNLGKLRVLGRERNYHTKSSVCGKCTLISPKILEMTKEILYHYKTWTTHRISKICTLLPFSLNCIPKPKTEHRKPGETQHILI